MTQPLSPQTELPPTDQTPRSGSAVDPQESYLNRARSSLRQALTRYNAFFRADKNRSPSGTDREMLRSDLEQLTVTLNKLESQVVRVAVFGLVSRGKSAVLNALLGQKLLPTGPLNGVTQAPQSIYWSPGGTVESAATTVGTMALASDTKSLTVELIDTPGLDEIDGQARAKMAQDIARQADLILFVVAGDITRTEYQALCDLRQAQKPLLLVFNKVDLYPDQTRQAIYQNLQQLAAKHVGGMKLQSLLSANEIVLVAADPAPLQIRVESPDGRITYEWEAPPVEIDRLKHKILAILRQEGRTLLALNALFQARDAEAALASKILDVRNTDAEALIWKFARYKAIAVGINPIAVVDLVGGAVSDLAMIRALSELYGLPVTRHEARKLWQTIFLSSGSLLVSELGSGLLLGLGKSAAAAAAGIETSTSFSAYAGTAIVQGGIAGYGAYAVGRAVQVYLEQGCSWGPQGSNTVIQDIINQLEPNTIIYRLRQELSQQLGLPGL
ncbi:GTP-binding protein [Stenomitos frigidus AS-A4]|uniref:GTP-binding protein n=1 Tax=Stenomitos frigidus AS-A4 TaxID=2933935 RepID=A0ABV0KG63_9CYAN|nr:GTP-binding protein [Phormidium sp. FACHB-592]